jgi:hypothetical protein
MKKVEINGCFIENYKHKKFNFSDRNHGTICATLIKRYKPNVKYRAN